MLGKPTAWQVRFQMQVRQKFALILTATFRHELHILGLLRIPLMIRYHHIVCHSLEVVIKN